MKRIIQCKFIDGQGVARGRDYAYYSDIQVEKGQMVDVPAPPTSSTDKSSTRTVMVTKTDVPESVIEPFRDKIKTIIGIHIESDGAE